MNEYQPNRVRLSGHQSAGARACREGLGGGA